MHGWMCISDFPSLPFHIVCILTTGEECNLGTFRLLHQSFSSGLPEAVAGFSFLPQHLSTWILAPNSLIVHISGDHRSLKLPTNSELTYYQALAEVGDATDGT